MEGQNMLVKDDQKIDLTNVGYIHSKQMSLSDQSWVLNRIPPICEICNKNDHFLIRKTRIRSLFSWFNTDQDNFEIYCPNCGDIIELDFEEYLVIKPIVKLNEKLENKTITWDEFDYKLANTLTKIHMKHKEK